MKLPFGRTAAPTPKISTPDDRMSLTEHLGELRTRIIRSLLAVVVGIIVVLAAYNTVLDVLLRPYRAISARPSRSSAPSVAATCSPSHRWPGSAHVCRSRPTAASSSPCP